MDTLDKLHVNLMNRIKTRESELPKLIKELEYLEMQLNSSSDINISYKYDILKEEIRRIKEDKMEYYLKTGDLLFQYYDSIENVPEQDVQNVSKGVVSYFKSIDVLKEDPSDRDVDRVSDSEEDSEEDSDIQKSFYLSHASREQLRNIYQQRMELPCHKKTLWTSQDGHDKTLNSIEQRCSNCETIMSCSITEGLIECSGCGYMENLLIDTDKPSYREPPKETSSYSYRRSNHFNEWIAQFQAKETTQIPKHVLYLILQEIKKERIHNLENLTHTKVRNLLKKLKLNKYYEHIPHIMNQLNGKPPPCISRQTEETFRLMFQEIQGPFLEYCPKNRKNFLSYSYVLHKFVELLGMNELKPLFPLLKSREKLHQQDQIWKKICEHVGWEYHKSM